MLRSQSKDTISLEILRNVEENISRYWADLGAELHFSTEKTQLFTGIQHPMFNGVLRANIPSAIAKTRVNEIINQFRIRRLAFRWFVQEKSKPGNLRTLLIDKGLNHTDTCCGLYHNLEGISRYQQKGLTINIQPVTNHDTMMIWAANFAEFMDISFKEAKKYADLLTRQGVKPFRHFIASQGGVCVGVVSLHFLSNIVGIHNLTVKRSVRGQGIGSSIISYLLTHSKKIGTEGVVLYAPSSLKDAFLGHGFDHIKNYDIFELDFEAKY